MLNGVNYYFGYGMNTNKSEMQWRCPGAVSLGHATLHDHGFAFRRFADVYPLDGSVVHGVMWHLDSEHFQALDILEGYPTHYDRKIMTVQHQGRSIKAWVYHMQDQSRISEPGSQYLYCLKEGYQEHSVPDYQIDRALKDCGVTMHYYYENCI